MLLAEPDALLAEEDRAGGVAAHPERDQGHHGRGADEHRRGDGDIENALHDVHQAPAGVRTQVQHRQAVDELVADVGTEEAEEPRDDVDLYLEMLERPQDVERLRVGMEVERHDHAFHAECLDDVHQLIR